MTDPHVAHLDGHDCVSDGCLDHNVALGPILMIQTKETSDALAAAAQDLAQLETQGLGQVDDAKLAP